jgi:hypothetical protein
MLIKYTKNFLNKLEEIISESDYMLRYEKGNFRPGYCLLRDKKVAIVNKYYPLEGKINALLELVNDIHPDIIRLSDKSKKLYLEITQTKLQI